MTIICKTTRRDSATIRRHHRFTFVRVNSSARWRRKKRKQKAPIVFFFLLGLVVFWKGEKLTSSVPKRVTFRYVKQNANTHSQHTQDWHIKQRKKRGWWRRTWIERWDEKVEWWRTRRRSGKKRRALDRWVIVDVRYVIALSLSCRITRERKKERASYYDSFIFARVVVTDCWVYRITGHQHVLQERRKDGKNAARYTTSYWS